MKNGEFFLERCLNSIREQTYQDYEIIIKRTGKGMAYNCNEGIIEATGDLIKILFMDDYLHDKHALKRLVDAHRGMWSATGCVHDNGEQLFNPHLPLWNDKMATGNNTIGSPSVLLFENRKDLPMFDINLKWLIDCDYYQRLYNQYGEPNLIKEIDIVIGIHDGQQTNLLSTYIKKREENYVKAKFA